MTIDELKLQIQEMIDKALEKKKAFEDNLPDGDVKNKEIEALKTQIATLESNLKDLLEKVTAPDFSNTDTDPDDPDPDKDAVPHKFKSLGHFAYDIMNEGPDHSKITDEMREYRIAVADRSKATQTVGAGETGGTLIPTEFSRMILERVTQDNAILQNAMVINMESNKVDIPVIMGFDESGGKVYGNIVWYWKGEEIQLTGSNFETAMVELVLRSCTGMARVSRDLMKYSPTSIEGILSRGFAYGMSQAITRAAIRGTGAGQPKGVLINGPHLISVAKDTNQHNDTFILDNLGEMFARLYSPNDDIGAGTWYANKTVIPQLFKLNQVVGLGGSGVFLMNQSVQEKPVYSLFGIPLKFNNQMSALGDTGDVGLFDWTQYLVGQPSGGLGGEMEQSIHLYFDYLSTAFRFVFDIDGQAWWPSEFKPEYGMSQAPFIKLDARKA